MEFPRFAFASGEEASDPVVQFEGAPVRVDELRASRHLERQDGDLEDVARLGLRLFRYGMPWRLTELSPGRYDWSLWDRALEACRRHGLEPVVDLCHFGLPDHYPGFADPSWVEGLLRYTEAFLARHRGPRWFTPVNEPQITALTAGALGIWNDRRTSAEDYARILAHCTLANLEALARIRADRGGWWIGAEAVSVPYGAAADPAAAASEARHAALARAAFDLPFGKPLDPLAEPAFAAVPDAVRARIEGLATTEHVIAGHDFYPVSVRSLAGPRESLSLAQHLDAYRWWARDWYARYGIDFWVSETSNLGFPVAQQVEWLDGLVGVLGDLNATGVRARGLCWYSRGDQYDWHTMLTQPRGEVTEVGLFDAERAPRPVAARIGELARAEAQRGD